ncbi:MFS transporter [Candidatus Liberibacter sp.]|uniref:MFS transporter n=1 Tax=Candidatus Liberibacter sp. TaxID=34022 RepID=UPI0015F6B66A|nr:MFS transporter [Candidatus Liberibacter sp.]MBA5724500.1 MFS transporter [Candidatus Liberibacter sp.]
MSAGHNENNSLKYSLKNHHKNLFFSSLGGALEFYDFIIFVFLAPTISKLFFPQEGTSDLILMLKSFGIFATGYIARPFGGIVLSHFGDIRGRKSVFSISIFMMAFATLAMAALPTYQTIGIAAPIILTVLRILQGLAIGGEVPGAWTFISEHVPARRVGFSCGCVATALHFGIFFGALISTILRYYFSPEEVLSYAWRIPFIIGGFFGLISIVLRRCILETPVFLKIKNMKAAQYQFPLKNVLNEHLSSTIIAFLLSWSTSVGTMVLTMLTPIFLQKQYAFNEFTAVTSNLISVFFCLIGMCLSGLLIDRISPSKFLISGGFLLAVSSAIFYSCLGLGVLTEKWLFILYSITHFFVGMTAAFPYILVRLFPARVRYSGISLSHNTAFAVSGATTPILIALFMGSYPMTLTFVMLSISLMIITMGLYFGMRGSSVLQKSYGSEELIS